jgi:hypothetical protein
VLVDEGVELAHERNILVDLEVRQAFFKMGNPMGAGICQFERDSVQGAWWQVAQPLGPVGEWELAYVLFQHPQHDLEAAPSELEV